MIFAALVFFGAAPANASDILFVYRSPASFPAGETVIIEGLMRGGYDVESAELVYRTSATGDWRNVELELMEGDHYRAEIAAEDVEPPQLEMYVVAVDFLEGRHAAFASADKPLVVPISARRSLEPSAPRREQVEVEAPPAAPAAQPTSPVTPPIAAPERHPLARLSRDHIEALGARDLGDVLAAMPEVELSLDLAGFRRVGIRGSRSPGDVLLLIDGHAANDPYDGGVLLVLPAAAIEEVTIWPGARRAAVLPSGLAGTIVVRTRPADGTWRIGAAGGAHASELTATGAPQRGTYRAEAAGGRDIAGIGIAGFVSFDFSDGTNVGTGADAHALGNRVSHAPGVVQDDHMGAAAGASIALDALVPGDLRLGTSYLYEDRGGYIGLVNTYGPNAGNTHHVWLASVTHHLPLEKGRELDARLGLDMHRFVRRSQLAPDRFQGDDLDGDGRPELYSQGVLEEQALTSFGVSGDVTAAMDLSPRQRLRSGVSVLYYAAGVPELRRNISREGLPADLARIDQPPARSETERLTLAAHIEDEWRSQFLAVSVGARAHWWNDVDNPELFDVLNPRVEVSLTPFDALEVAVLYGVLSRPPTVNERADVGPLTLPPFLAGERFVGDPLLGASAAHTIEISTTLAQRIGTLGYHGTASAAWMRLVDGIEAVQATPETDEVSARPRAERLGVALEGRVDFTERSQLWLGAWWASAADFAAGERTSLTSTPRTGALFGARIELGAAADVSLALRYEGARRNDRRTLVEESRPWRIPDETTVDAALRTRPLWGGWRAGLSAHNLFDADRRDPAPVASATPELVPRPGRLVLLSLTFTDES